MIEFEFVTASHDKSVLANNLLRSTAVTRHALTVQKGFTNISEAYNRAVCSCTAPIIIYVHHDVYLPDSFESDLEKALGRLPDDWGVLGVAGVRFVDHFKKNFGHIQDRGKEWGSSWKLPQEVATLDEMLLITRGDLRFDEQFPQDFYGADLCMQAQAKGKKCYAVSAYCEHNSSRAVGGRTESFYESEERFRGKWKQYLPIPTTCTIVRNV